MNHPSIHANDSVDNEIAPVSASAGPKKGRAVRSRPAPVSIPVEEEQWLDLTKWSDEMLRRAETIGGKPEAPFDPLESAALHALRLRLVELTTERSPDYAQIKTVFGLLLEARAHQLAERKLEFTRREMAEDGKSRVLTAEQLQERMKTLFGWVESGDRTEEAS